MKRLFPRLVIAVIASYVALLAVQLALPWVSSVVVRTPFDTPAVRSSVEISRELTDRGQDVAVLVYPALWLADALPGGEPAVPLGGISRKRTVLCEEQPGRPVTYMSDRHGFRNRSDWGAASASRSFATVAIGDSFAQGACMEAGNGLVDLLEEHVGPIANLAVSGDGPLLELATLKEYAAILRPKRVLWFYYRGNDLWDLWSERAHPILAKYLDRGFSQHLPARQTEIDTRLSGWLADAWNRYDRAQLTQMIDGQPSQADRLLAFLKLSPLVQATRMKSAPSDETVDLFIRIMREARDTVAGWGGQVVFVNLADHRPSTGQSAPMRRIHGRTIQGVTDLGIRVIDVEPATDGLSRSGLFFYSTSHYSDAGNRIVADALARELGRVDGTRPR